MKVSYSWLSTYFDKALPAPEKLGELLNAHAFELEGLEKVGDDTVLDLKVLPDRSHYALCHKGIAREVSVITRIPLKKPQNELITVHNALAEVSVSVDETSLCRRYMARRIEGVHAGSSPRDIAGALESIGARSINAVVDATNYVMFDCGQPLHAFDADKVSGSIVVRKARAGEKITILDGREIELREHDLVIADDLGPLALAGVKGGKRAEVTSATKNIIIEAANFSPTGVRKTATRTNLRNDSSKRFENDITPALASEALERVTALILKISPGAIAGPITDIYPLPVQPWQVTVSVSYISSMVGFTVSSSECKDILERQGCVVTVSGDTLSVTPPFERLDLVIPEDIGDEIARIKGYGELIGVETPAVPRVAINPVFFWSEKIKNILVAKGFSETLLYTLVPKGVFEVSYPLANDKSALRETLSPKLTQSLAHNARNADLLGLEAITLFEIGKVFPKTGEKTALVIGACQIKKKKGVTSEGIVKDALAVLSNALGYEIKGKIETGPFGAVVEVDLDMVVEKLATPTGFGDIGFSPISKDIQYKPFSHFPFITRDIALFVPVFVTAGEVAAALRTAALATAGKLLVKGPDLFDTFSKDGKNSFAFRMIFQSFEKTLSDDEVNGYMTVVYDTVRKQGWEVR